MLEYISKKAKQLSARDERDRDYMPWVPAFGDQPVRRDTQMLHLLRRQLSVNRMLILLQFVISWLIRHFLACGS